MESKPDLIPLGVLVRTIKARIITLEWEDPDHPALKVLRETLADAEQQIKEGKLYMPTF